MHLHRYIIQALRRFAAHRASLLGQYPWITTVSIDTYNRWTSDETMSFFGFDSTLPRDRQGQGATKGIFEQDNPFAGIAQARKLQAFQNNEDEM